MKEATIYIINVTHEWGQEVIGGVLSKTHIFTRKLAEETIRKIESSGDFENPSFEIKETEVLIPENQ